VRYELRHNQDVIRRLGGGPDFLHRFARPDEPKINILTIRSLHTFGLPGQQANYSHCQFIHCAAPLPKRHARYTNHEILSG
jgi:hypothetical protein